MSENELLNNHISKLEESLASLQDDMENMCRMWGEEQIEYNKLREAVKSLLNAMDDLSLFIPPGWKRRYVWRCVENAVRVLRAALCMEMLK